MPCLAHLPAGDIPRSNIAFIADALASMLGGLLGTSGEGEVLGYCQRACSTPAIPAGLESSCMRTSSTHTDPMRCIIGMWPPRYLQPLHVMWSRLPACARVAEQVRPCLVPSNSRNSEPGNGSCFVTTRQGGWQHSATR